MLAGKILNPFLAAGPFKSMDWLLSDRDLCHERVDVISICYNREVERVMNILFINFFIRVT